MKPKCLLESVDQDREGKNELAPPQLVIYMVWRVDCKRFYKRDNCLIFKSFI